MLGIIIILSQMSQQGSFYTKKQTNKILKKQ